MKNLRLSMLSLHQSRYVPAVTVLNFLIAYNNGCSKFCNILLYKNGVSKLNKNGVSKLNKKTFKVLFANKKACENRLFYFDLLTIMLQVQSIQSLANVELWSQTIHHTRLLLNADNLQMQSLHRYLYTAQALHNRPEL